MDFKFLLSELEKLNLPKKDFVVISSGSMAVRGIREANDLDIMVNKELWENLAAKYPIKAEKGIKSLDINEYIEIVGEGSTFKDDSTATEKEIFETADNIDGINYMNLELLVKFKKKMGREKDLEDIELIKKYLQIPKSA